MPAAAPTVPVQQSGLIIDGRTPAVLLQNAKTALNKGGITHLVIELCASHNSELTATVPPRCAAIRVTARDDLTFQKTYKVLRDIIRHALKLGVHVLTWASTPCTAGCPWQRINRALGRASGDEQMTNALNQNATKLCKLTLTFGGYFAREWPERCDLWKDPRVQELTSQPGKFSTIATSAVEWHDFLKHKHGETKVYQRNKWKVFSTCPGLAEAFAPYAIDANAAGKEFTECRGRLAAKSANYTPMMCQTFWQAFC